jgi:large subunit ribosomal protein L11
MAELIKHVLKLAKGSSVPNRDKVGKMTKEQALRIAERKMQDLNARDPEAAIQMVLGTGRSMGIDYVEA